MSQKPAVIIAVLLFFITSISPMMAPSQLGEVVVSQTSSEPWDSMAQPWGQFGRTPSHNSTMPPHSDTGGANGGDVANVSVYGVIDEPAINWQALDDADGADAYGSIIGDFSASITATSSAIERCGQGELFAVIISSESNGDDMISKLSIYTGDDAKLAWQVSLGATLTIRSTPILVDTDNDGRLEIIVTYDTDAAFNVEVWSPELTCSESGWQSSGHSNEKVWDYSESGYRISAPSPHAPSSQTGHRAHTQPLVADLALDGTPEYVAAVIDESTNDPTLIALPLTTTSSPDPLWEVALDRGDLPSDPAWAALDSSNTAVVLTTIDSNLGNMWIWKVDGASGSLDWERVSISGTDSDDDAPRLRLPGPVIAQLDSDDAPEMILTVPTDANGRTSGFGARFIGMEMTSTTEIFNFRTPNGYADTHPIALDTDDDGVDDRLCWVTWYSESAFNFNRKGMAGCHDISLESPLKEWSRDLQRGSGTDNDEIAVAPPAWMDIDDDNYPEIIIAYGKRLFAFDGDTGASADISNGWSTPLSMPHRVWAEPAIADMDGDGTLDILVGDTLVSQAGSDLAPLADNRGISFNPAQADPGMQVTITGTFSNIGVSDNEEDVDAIILLNGVEIKRERFDDVKPVAPSGEGGPQTFSVDITAELGIHDVEMILDVNGNISEAREDNNRAVAQLVIVEPYDARIDIPTTTTRISPGLSQTVTVDITATGSRQADWTMTWDDSALPDGWTFSTVSGSDYTPNLIPELTTSVQFDVSIPSDAMGDENSYVDLTLTLDSDGTVSTSVRLPIEVLRTRGLSIVGPSGLDVSEGYGRPGQMASAWIIIENLGNAQESSTSIDWTAPSWQNQPGLYTSAGIEVFSIDLDPKEKVELFAQIQTPAAVSLGSSTSTTLTVCIGSGSDTLCEDMTVNFTATAIEIDPIHTTTLPNTSHSWDISAEIPSDGKLTWNMVSASMINTDWQWSASGALSINGTNLELSGQPGQVVSGQLALTLPVNAQPQRHTFHSPDDALSGHDLLFTLNVQQIHRAKLTVLSPTPLAGQDTIGLNVSEAHRVQIRLENPGNGEDTYELVGRAIMGSGMSEAPDVQFAMNNNQQRTLGSLASSVVSIDITLAEDIPALTPFQIEFSFTSILNNSASQAVVLDVMAEADHEWALTTVGGDERVVYPDEELEFAIDIHNLGNSVDNLTLKPVFQVFYEGDDSSTWSAQEVTSSMVAINDTSTITFPLTIPSDTWKGTDVTLVLQQYSAGYHLGDHSISLEVGHSSGWRFNVSGVDLEVDADGENLTLVVDQLGNSPTAPFFTKASEGWQVETPVSGDIVNPGQSTTVTVFVTPPEGAIAGEVGVLRLRISDWNGAGQIVQEIPVRVGAQPNISLGQVGSWLVDDEGGMPTAWVENLGNDVALLQLSLSGVPSGWGIDSPGQMVVSPGQIMGMPVSLIPHENWNGERFLVTIEVTHETLGLITQDIEVASSSTAFSSTPVISGNEGQMRDVIVRNGAGISTNPSHSESGETWTFTLGGEDQTTSFSESDGEETLYIFLSGKELPDVIADCDLNNSAFSSLGISSVLGHIGDCEITASNDEPVRASILLVTDRGESIRIDEDSLYLAKGLNDSIAVNLSSAWLPSAGQIEITLMLVDNYGRILASDSLDTVAHAKGWNIGIYSFSAEGDIKIGIERTSFERLENTLCKIEIESDDGKFSLTKYVDIAGSDYAPIIFIENPGTLKTDDKLTATLSCESPYDIDDNQDDNVKSTFYKEESVALVESSDYLWSLAIAALILVVAYFMGYLTPGQAGQQELERPEGVSAKQTVEPTAEKPEPQSTTQVSSKQAALQRQMEKMEEDDISFESEQKPVEPIQEPEDLQSQALDLVEVVEQEEVVDDTVLGRFASLRSEIKGDEEQATPQGSIEDRMAKFFDE